MKLEKIRYIIKVQIGSQVYYSTEIASNGVSYNEHVKGLCRAMQEGEVFRLDTKNGTHLFGVEALSKSVISFIIVE